MTSKKGMTTNFFSPMSFIAVFGSGIRDPGWDPGSGMSKNQDPGSGTRDKHPGSATVLKTLFCKQCFSPLNTFIRKGKDPKLWIWLGTGPLTSESKSGCPKTYGSWIRIPNTYKQITRLGVPSAGTLSSVVGARSLVIGGVAAPVAEATATAQLE